MQTPIYDFVRQYNRDSYSRLHMPGHKGVGPLGCECLDITEITGADSLFEADGIIRKSEENAASLFGSAMTLYSTEGSSLCVRAMLYLVLLNNGGTSVPVIAAGRNAHASFIKTAALLRFRIDWLFDEDESGEFSLCRARVTERGLEKYLSDAVKAKRELPCAIYITSPDYLGNVADISGLSVTAHRYGIPLIVDNAHGAYRRFLKADGHPITLGADMCCDSAHKTLPVLTGGAYLHISANAPALYIKQARRAMSLFASTSPSYLIMESLDLANAYLADGFTEKLDKVIIQADECKKQIMDMGFDVCESDECRITVETIKKGITGNQMLKLLMENKVMCEYADPDYVVLMFTAQTCEKDFERIIKAFYVNRNYGGRIAERPELSLLHPQVRYMPHELLFVGGKDVNVDESEGKILCAPAVSCPPAVSVVVSGEVISAQAVKIFKYYGINTVNVCDEMKTDSVL